MSKVAFRSRLNLRKYVFHEKYLLLISLQLASISNYMILCILGIMIFNPELKGYSVVLRLA